MTRSWFMSRRCMLGLVCVLLVVPWPSTGRAAPDAGGSEHSPLRFVLDTPLHVGGKTRVRLRNTGEVAYIYNPYYEACEMVFRDSSGREFLVPEGTHCDLVAREEVAPGETVTLFRWDLDECVEDNWGCTKARDLRKGRYSMRGWFRPEGGGDRIRVVRRFRIRP